MKKLNIIVCENFCPEFKHEVEALGFDDVAVLAYPSMCEDRRNKDVSAKLLQDCIDKGDDAIILCSKQCEIANCLPENAANLSVKIQKTNYCFQHLANDAFLEYILSLGGYVIGLGWLNNWRGHIEKAGFDEALARIFYKEFCKELVFFDSGIDKTATDKLKELSSFLDIPYVIVPFESVNISLLVKSHTFEWRLQNLTTESKTAIKQAQTQSAEYSTILDLIGKIATYTNKRETIAKVKEIFTMILGAQSFKFIEGDSIKNFKKADILNLNESIDSFKANNDGDSSIGKNRGFLAGDEDLVFDDNFLLEIDELLSDSTRRYILNRDKEQFCIKIIQNNKIYGAIVVGGFLFPRYIEKYLNFAIEISSICGLVLSNIEQYDKLLKSEKNLQYLSYHDALTGLYNRGYINDVLDMQKEKKMIAVFGFDIDRLKFVNDTKGHIEGDKLIIAVSSILRDSFRDSDIVARIGGDEFVVILLDCDSNMAEKFERRVYEEILHYNNQIKVKHLEVSLSFGYAVSNSNEESIEELINRADSLMYANKEKKKQRLSARN